MKRRTAAHLVMAFLTAMAAYQITAALLNR